MDMVTTTIKAAPLPLTQDWHSEVLPTTYKILAESMDHELLQVGAICLFNGLLRIAALKSISFFSEWVLFLKRVFDQSGCRQHRWKVGANSCEYWLVLTPWSRYPNGETPLSITLSIIKRLLSSPDSDSSAVFVGDVIRGLVQKVLSTNLFCRKM